MNSIDKLDVNLLSTSDLRKLLLKTYFWDNSIKNTYNRQGLIVTYIRGLNGVHKNQFTKNLSEYLKDNPQKITKKVY